MCELRYYSDLGHSANWSADVIEVRRRAGDQMPAATWVISRRYSEFHELNKRLRAKFPPVRNLEFPRRQMMLKLQKDFLHKRRLGLEKYLRVSDGMINVEHQCPNQRWHRNCYLYQQYVAAVNSERSFPRLPSIQLMLCGTTIQTQTIL